MNCNTCLKQLPLYIDGGLSEPIKNDIDAHIDNCTRCHNEYRVLIEQENIIKNVENRSPSVLLWKEIEKKISITRTSRRKLPLFYVLLSGSLIIITLLIYFFFRYFSVSISRRNGTRTTSVITDRHSIDTVQILNKSKEGSK